MGLLKKIFDEIEDFKDWSPCQFDDLELNDDTESDEEVIDKINKEDKIILVDTETGEVLAKDGAQLVQAEWDELAKVYEEETESENALWMTKPENAEELLDYKKYVSDSVEESEVIDLLRKVEREDYFSILNLSRYASSLYEQGRQEKADEKVNEIGGQYGSRGRHLFNLYSAGYFDRVIDEFEEEKEKSMSDRKKAELIESSIRELMARPIHFVGKDIDLRQEVADINQEVDQGREFIAVHGIGEESIINVVRILSKTVQYAEENNYEINISHEPKTYTLELKLSYIKQ